MGETLAAFEMRHYLHQRFRKIGMVTTVLIFILLPLSEFAGQQPSRTGGITRGEGSKPGNMGALAQGMKPQTVANATPRPFLRFVAVLFSGLVITAARLGLRFRRFWGLGVFTNPYSLVFLGFGVGLSGVPMTGEGLLSSIPGLQALGPWIADLSGIIVTFAMPIIGHKPKAGNKNNTNVRDLERASTSNPVVAVIEDAIRNQILARMQLEIIKATRLYDWDTIKLAESRALEEEMTVRPLEKEEYDAVRLSIDSFQANADHRIDSSNKYKALLQCLRWCSFQRIRSGLEVAARETRA